MRLTHYLRYAFLACALAASLRAAAVDITQLENPELQARYDVLTHELRCMKCQNQSIADSPVGLASDLRRQVQELLVAGKSDDEIRAYMVARYGDFILFRPQFNLVTGWVWIAPILLLLGGILVGVRIVRARAGLVATDTSQVDTEETPR
jgi:cytochrome c-type biogenesis protein CcmH